MDSSQNVTVTNHVVAKPVLLSVAEIAAVSGSGRTSSIARGGVIIGVGVLLTGDGPQGGGSVFGGGGGGGMSPALSQY